MKNNLTAVSLKNVGVVYKSGTSIFKKNKPFVALKDVSFDIRKGESLGVVGSNGAGKSTLLNLLSGIIEPDNGKISFSVDSPSLLTLNAGVEPFVSAKDNAILTGMLLGLSYEEITNKLPSVFKLAELEGFEDTIIKNYSSGMKARLGFSVAVNVNSDLLLIDEVLAVGDAKFRKKSRTIMADIIKSGKTIVLVSHSSSQIRELCDRVLWLNKGQVHEIGSAGEIMDRYDSIMGRVD